MWLYLPSTESQSAPASEGSSSAWDQLSEDLERSATWNGKSRSQKSWWRVLRTGALTMLQSGRIYEHSTQLLGAEKFISSLEDFHVSPSHTPHSIGSKRPTNETSGLMSDESLMDLGFQESFWKTSQAFSTIGIRPVDVNFDRWATRLKRDSLRRRRSVRPTSGNGFSFWPTATANRATYSNGVHGPNLIESAKAWPTPNAGPQNDRDTKWQERRAKLRAKHNNGNGFGLTLGMAATNWPTPATRDYKGFDPPGKTNAHQDPALYLSSHLAQPTGMDGHICSTKCRRLNQRFVQLLMGFPLGWTEPSVRLEMPLFRQWRQRLGSNLTKP